MTRKLGTISYSQNAAFWTNIIRNRRDRYRVDITDSAVLSMIGPAAGIHILDMGCGEGYLSREIAKRGANVVGADVTPELIEAANQEAKQLDLDITYAIADASNLPTDFDRRFDVVVFNHVVNDLEDPRVAFIEAARTLRVGGRLIVLMLHPCFTLQNRGAAEYFSNFRTVRHFEVDGTVSPAPVTYWTRSLESYSSFLAEAGFAVTQIREPRPTDDTMKTDPWWKKHFTWPKFLLFEARLLAYPGANSSA